MGRKEDVYEQALKGKNIPILTLDHKWHMLFSAADVTPAISRMEEELNALLKRQGKLNTEMKDIRRIKKKLMEEIVPLVDELEQTGDAKLEKKIENHKRLIAECNEKMESHKDELLDLPKEIEQVNYKLMLATMEICYEKIQGNTAEIEEVGAWITEMRMELKKKIIRKQEKEQQNQDLYSYMHAIFGAEVIDIFDMKYNPENKPLKAPEKKSKKAAKQVEQHVQAEQGADNTDGN